MTLNKPWYKQITDPATSTVTYLGYAEPGTATSAAEWLIQRQTVASGVVTIEFCDSDRNFDNVWDDRSTLSYG